MSISIGGWGAGGLSDAAPTDASRKKVVGACLNTFFRTQTGKGKYGDPYDPANSFDLGGIAKALDWVNLMTYDMGMGFSPVSTFNAPMAPVPADPLGQPMKRWNNVTGAVRYYEQHGVPADRIVLGVPFYGRGFHVTRAGPNHGLFQPWDTSFDPGSWGDITKLLTDPAWEQHWDVARSRRGCTTRPSGSS